MALGKNTLTALAAAAAVAVGAGGAAVALENGSTTTTTTTSAATSEITAHTATAGAQPLSVGPYSATFHWGGVTEAGQTGYYVYQNGTQVADVTVPTYTFTGLNCGSTLTFGVAAHDNSGNTSPTSTTTYSTPSCGGGGGSGLHVSGNQLMNGTTPVFIHGMNRAGTEFSCSEGNGFFDGTNSSFAAEDTQTTSMASWGVNSEMIGLNEDCWLGINGSPSAYSNSSSTVPTPGCTAAQCPYANAIEHIVQTDEANHIFPVISLFALAPGTALPESSGFGAHIPLADNDHAPLFWEEVADFFKNDPNVIFRLEQEPTLYYGTEPDWQCWSQGDVSYSTASVNTPPTPPSPTGTPNKCSGPGLVTFNGTPYQTVGMQSMVNIVRGAGASNIIMLSGLGFANMYSCGPATAPSACGMLNASTPVVVDPNTDMMAAADVYPDGNTCGPIPCDNVVYKPVANIMPFVAGETAENPANGYAPTTQVDAFLAWMDSNANGYYPYAWDPWANIINSYTADNTSAHPYQTVWGADYYDHINGISLPAPTQPTDGITFAHNVSAPCTFGGFNGAAFPTGSVSIPGPVNAGDTLVAVFSGQGYTTAASQVTGVSDSTNGAWTKVGGGASQASGSLNVSYQVFDVPSSSAASGGLTVTITGSAGGGNSSLMSAQLFDLRGVTSVRASSFQSTINAGSTSYTGPTLTAVPSNDLVFGVWGAYSGSSPAANLTAAAPWTTQVTNFWTASINCPLAGADWMQASSTGNVTAAAGSDTGLPYYGGVLDLHP